MLTSAEHEELRAIRAADAERRAANRTMMDAAGVPQNASVRRGFSKATRWGQERITRIEARHGRWLVDTADTVSYATWLIGPRGATRKIIDGWGSPGR